MRDRALHRLEHEEVALLIKLTVEQTRSRWPALDVLDPNLALRYPTLRPEQLDWYEAVCELGFALTHVRPAPDHLANPLLASIASGSEASVDPSGGASWTRWARLAWASAALGKLMPRAATLLAEQRILVAASLGVAQPDRALSRAHRALLDLQAAQISVRQLLDALELVLRAIEAAGVPLAVEVAALASTRAAEWAGDAIESFERSLGGLLANVDAYLLKAEAPPQRARLLQLLSLPARLVPRLPDKHLAFFGRELQTLARVLAEQELAADPEQVAPLLSSLSRAVVSRDPSEREAAIAQLDDDLPNGFLRRLRAGEFAEGPVDSEGGPQSAPLMAGLHDDATHASPNARETPSEPLAALEGASAPQQEREVSSYDDGAGSAAATTDHPTHEPPHASETAGGFLPAPETSSVRLEHEPVPPNDVGNAVATAAPDPAASLPPPAPAMLSEPVIDRPTNYVGASQMPHELRTLASFAERSWISPEGTLEDAPWREGQAFEGSMEAAFEAELARAEPSFLALWLFAQTAQSRLPRVEDVAALGYLWQFRASSGVLAGDRSVRLAEVDTLAASLRSRLPFMVEALRPSTTQPLPADVEAYIATLEFQDGDVRAALASLFRIGSALEDPVARIRAVLRGTAPSEAPELMLERRRREFHELFASAQGNQLIRWQTKFCQLCWLSFLRDIESDLRPLMPLERGGAADWDEPQMGKVLDTLGARHAKIADRGGARYSDRAHMDKVAARIEAAAREVVSAKRRIDVARSLRSPTSSGVPLQIEAFRRLLARERPLERPDEEFFRRLLKRLLESEPRHDATSALAVTWAELGRWPALARALPAVAPDASAELMQVADLPDARFAAATVAVPGHVPSLTREAVVSDLEADAYALEPLQALLAPRDREGLRSRAARRDEELARKRSQLRRRVRALRDAASPWSGPLDAARRELEERYDAAEQVSPWYPAGLLEAWLNALLEASARELAASRTSILQEAADNDDVDLEGIETLVNEERFGEALARLRGTAAPMAQARRLTLHRADAKDHYAKARPPAFWTKTSTQFYHTEKSLRIEFAKQLLGDRLYRTDLQISTRAIRDEIERKKLNPSFFPQLARARHLVFPAAGVPASDPGFVTNATSAAAAHKQDLAIILAPKITSERREDLRRKLREQHLTAAVIDDLDVMRLFNPGGDRPDGLLALLEVAYEQQRWTTASPGLPDGQHVHLEMYVGREEEAQRLALTSRYSRLFSGRKLGKSALLRYIASRFDGAQLPSALTLRVLYVSAVGRARAGEMVDEIIDAVVKRFGALKVQDSGDRTPADRLTVFVRRFLEEHPTESLLIVLDEADNFVEQELIEYAEHREACLSFVMRSRIEEEVDVQGLPRVRFIFTGYRLTHTSEGAWANWGDVLRLVPLPAEDASKLAGGPLARIGIDASDEAASIAHRCGYQPAVILRFTERLLERLEKSVPHAVRERTVTRVTAEDTAAIFEDELFQREIRQVVENNFQSNARGRIVFGALIAEFLRAGPRAGIEHAEERVVARLEGLSGAEDLAWLGPEGRSARDEVQRHLGDFAERQLVFYRRSSHAWFLRFPHHLQILEPLAREEALQDEIRRLRSREPAHGVRARGLLPVHDVQRARYVATDPSFKIVPVLGSLMSERSGEQLLMRGVIEGTLDFSRQQVALFTAGWPKEQVPRAVVGVPGADLSELLSRCLATTRPPLLVGGLDLIRAAIAHEVTNVGGEDVGLEVVGLGRWSRTTVEWWLTEMRGFHFAEPADLDRLYAATSGLPLLVAELDACLAAYSPGSGDLDVTPSLAKEAERTLAEALPTITSMLVSGGPAICLRPREIELLRMIAKLEGDREPGIMLVDEDFPSMVGLGELRPYHLEDDSLLLGLQLVGLVPSRRDGGLRPVDRLGPLDSNDALLGLVRALG